MAAAWPRSVMAVSSVRPGTTQDWAIVLAVVECLDAVSMDRFDCTHGRGCLIKGTRRVFHHIIYYPTVPAPVPWPRQQPPSFVPFTGNSRRLDAIPEGEESEK